MKKLTRILGLFIFIGIICCKSDDEKGRDDNQKAAFDRKAMLENWADNIIIPAFKDFQTKVGSLKIGVADFTQNTTQDNLIDMRKKWQQAYGAWQQVSFFDLGKAKELSLRIFMNTYPASVVKIKEEILKATYDLEHSYKKDAQGFPAIDYLINGTGSNDEQIITFFSTDTHANSNKVFLQKIVDRINKLTEQVVQDWENGFRNTFVNNSGSSVSGAISRQVNNYIYHYEMYFRDGKVGIPAGVRSSSTPFADKVEALYKKDISKILFQENLKALKNFFQGTGFNSKTTGVSLEQYLDALNKKGLSNEIMTNFDQIEVAIKDYNNNFYEIVKKDNGKMKSLYDKVQKNVVSLKTQMLSVLGINIDYVDNDGD